MEKALVLTFNDEKGATCQSCMLSFSKGEKYHCAAIGSRPICPEDGNRSDCPLVEIFPDEKKELIDLLNEASEEIQNLYGNETDLSERLWNKAEEIEQLN